ncbi:MAG: hypothetical protein GX938_02435 [Spirochaetales bacterium]|nr:hypothetical protein [Spirochaetales bacterium]
MAYCVMCGVKLSDGAETCPLCNTRVVLPPGIEEKHSQPLFAQPLEIEVTTAITKRRKGIIELVISLFVVGEVAVALSLWLSGLARYSYIPLLSIAAVAFYLVIALRSVLTYRRQATIFLIASALYLIGLDAADLHLSWSLIAAPPLALVWLVGVYSFSRPPLLRFLFLLIGTTGIYLAHLNRLIVGSLTWFWPVAMPAMGSDIILTALFAVFLSRRTRPPSLVEMVFSALTIIFLGLTVLDLMLSKYTLGFFKLRWSESLLYAALIILIFLIALSCSRRLRRYFTSRGHQA